MDSNHDLRGYFATKSQKQAVASQGLLLRRWISFLFGYPAIESLIPIFLNLLAPKFAFYQIAVVSLVQVIILAIGIYLIWSKKRLVTLLALVPAAIYIALSVAIGTLLTLTTLSVIIGSVCVIVLASSLSSRPRA
jgi:hypothetical protein